MRLRWWGLSVACACTWSSSALADSAQGKRPSPIAAEPGQLLDARAAAAFRAGIAAFDRQDFEAARVAFLQTYALKPEAVVVRRNLGLAEIYSGYYLDGARRLARVLHTTAEGSAEDRARMLQSLKLAEAHLERISVEVAQQGAQIHIDGVDLGSSPLPIFWYVLPGPYRVRVDKPGFVGYAESRLARAGSAQQLRVVLQPVVTKPAPVSVPVPAPPPSVPLQPPELGPNPWLLLTGGALTAGALAAGAVFSIKAAGSEDRAAQLRAELRSFSCNTPDVFRCDELMEATHRHDRQVRVAFASFIGAGVTGAATLLYGLLAGGGEGPAAAEGEQSATRAGWELHAWQGGPYAAWTAEF
ncbi:MAG: hypothetical protein RL033_4156 [Pseudomonadota bacterium]